MNKGLAKFLSCFIPNKLKRHNFFYKLSFNGIDMYDSKKFVTEFEESQDIIANLINSNKPCLVCRFGNNEFKTLYTYIKKHSRYSKRLKENMYNGAGFYPVEKNYLDKFSQELLSILPNIDILGAWCSNEEAEICKKYCSENIIYTYLGNILRPIDNSWTKNLKGKKVLVIHPFVETIKNQYQKREHLFENKDILPEFELLTYKPVQSMADNKALYPFNSWFDALESMQKDIKDIDFEIAIIGAGAYGIFLADYCKKLGKQAIHSGGITQLLFGIKGKRWEIEQSEIIKDIVNEYWVRPSDSEKPEGFNKIEGGCYW